MSERTGIEWTDHTFNPWSGCHKVSPACTNCYAANLPPSMRRGAVWGKDTERVPASESYWRGPLAWDKAAAKAGVRRRVFCASVADVFEERAELATWRMRLWTLIKATPNLDWLLLTKRPHYIPHALPGDWGDGYANVWLGTTVEDQKRADERVPALLDVPAVVRFLSMEPLRERVDLTPWVYPLPDAAARSPGMTDDDVRSGIHWVIAGGESGTRARPSHPGWYRDLRDQCAAASVAYFFKQWGEWAPLNHGAGGDLCIDYGVPWTLAGFFDYCDRWNGPPDEGWEPNSANPFRQTMARVGKHAAGRLLDGVTHSAFPKAVA